MKIVKRQPNKGYLDNWLWAPKQYINVDAVKSALTHVFSDSRSTYKVRYVYLYKETQYHLLVPRMLWDLSSLPFPVIDCRPNEYGKVNIVSKIKLDHRLQDDSNGNKVLVPTGRDIQQRSLNALLSSRSGILQLFCGAGKSVITLEFIARLQGAAIIVVDNTQLLEQWRKEIEAWLELPDEVGVVQANKFDWKRSIVLSTYQTLGKLSRTATEEFRRYFKVAVFEEGHHSSAATFCPSLEAFYGYRLLLSATPKRDDGTHVIYDMHIGPVVHQDLKQDLTSRIAFDWTGLQLDETRPDCNVRDSNGELHLSMLAVYYGRWVEHLNHVLRRVWEAAQTGRQILVLCNSVDEAINLCALWNGMPDLYTDIPIPSPQDVGETLSPIQLTKKQHELRVKEVQSIEYQLASGGLSQQKQDQLDLKKSNYELVLKQYEVYRKIRKEMSLRQKAYRERLKDCISTGGLMIYKIPAKERLQYLNSKQVVFCIKKYGRDGLDKRSLDTIISTMPFVNPGSIQQIKGRVERQKTGKKAPLLLIVEHTIGPVIGMCQKMRKHLREWPVEGGGPLNYELHGHPKANTCQTTLF